MGVEMAMNTLIIIQIIQIICSPSYFTYTKVSKSMNNLDNTNNFERIPLFFRIGVRNG